MAVIGSSTAGGDGRRRREGGSGHWTGCCSMWALDVEERKKKKEEERWAYILRFLAYALPSSSEVLAVVDGLIGLHVCFTAGAVR